MGEIAVEEVLGRADAFGVGQADCRAAGFAVAGAFKRDARQFQRLAREEQRAPRALQRAGDDLAADAADAFRDVNEGAIIIGGVDIRDMAPERLSELITVVFQDVYLFSGTIFDNIAFGRPDAAPADIEAAAKTAQAHDFIMALPDGYDTRVGEGGASLSGGERQRISIARAMLKDAPIVLLDEATAAIDPTNERALQKALAALVKGKTLIVVAHKLSTVREADQILILDNGRIAERGDHDSLVESDGLYHRLWLSWTKAAHWRLKG